MFIESFGVELNYPHGLPKTPRLVTERYVCTMLQFNLVHPYSKLGSVQVEFLISEIIITGAEKLSLGACLGSFFTSLWF